MCSAKVEDQSEVIERLAKSIEQGGQIEQLRKSIEQLEKSVEQLQKATRVLLVQAYAQRANDPHTLRMAEELLEAMKWMEQG